MVVKTDAQPDGAIKASISATQSSGALDNQLHAIRVSSLTNAVVDVQGQTLSSIGQMVTLPAGTHQVSISVRPIVANQPTLATLGVMDDCGEWRTFVGAGH